MARRLLKKWLPHPDKVRSHPSIEMFGDLLQDPNLWHLNRHSVSIAVFIGLFTAFIPLPLQMGIAALAAIGLRANLPISVTLVWITNPVTMPAIFYLCYKVGAVILGTKIGAFSFELSWAWLEAELLRIWRPFLLGCFVSGLFAGLLGATVTNSLWRHYVIQRWRRRQRRLNAAKPAKKD